MERNHVKIVFFERDQIVFEKEGLYLRKASLECRGNRLTDGRDGRILARRDQNQLEGFRGDILTW